MDKIMNVTYLSKLYAKQMSAWSAYEHVFSVGEHIELTKTLVLVY